MVSFGFDTNPPPPTPINTHGSPAVLVGTCPWLAHILRGLPMKMKEQGKEGGKDECGSAEKRWRVQLTLLRWEEAIGICVRGGVNDGSVE